jgi:hypothetical protein
MSFLTKITLTTAGSSTGPFDIYQNSDNYATAVATGVTKSDLVAGYTISVNDTTTSVLVQSLGLCNTSNITLPISGFPTSTPTPTPTLTPTASPVGAGVSHISLSSGHTVASACTGATQTYYYSGSFINGAQLWVDAQFTDNAPGTNGSPVYYYSYDFNSIYYINDSEGHKYASSEVCPTATPVVNANSYWVSTVDGPTAATCGGDDVFGVPHTQLTGFTVYGSAISGICDATMIVDMPAIVKSEVPFNGTFWVGKKVGGNFYYRKYVRDSSGTSATPDGACVVYNTPCN